MMSDESKQKTAKLGIRLYAGNTLVAVCNNQALWSRILGIIMEIHPPKLEKTDDE